MSSRSSNNGHLRTQYKLENNPRWDSRSSKLESKESLVLSTLQGVPFCSSKTLQRSSPHDQLSIWVG